MARKLIEAPDLTKGGQSSTPSKSTDNKELVDALKTITEKAQETDSLKKMMRSELDSIRKDISKLSASIQTGRLVDNKEVQNLSTEQKELDSKVSELNGKVKQVTTKIDELTVKPLPPSQEDMDSIKEATSGIKKDVEWLLDEVDRINNAKLKDKKLQTTYMVNEGMTTAQKDKLDGIESGATKYPDTGEQAFTDADHSKLDGVEVSAVALATVKADSDVADAITKKHTQGTDTTLGTMAGDINLGANKLKVTDGLLKTQAGWGLWVRNAADDANANLEAKDLSLSGYLTMDSNASTIQALNDESSYLMLKARDTGVGEAEVARLQGAADPYFQATLPMVLKPIATASLPTTPVEGMIAYDDTLNKFVVYTGAAWVPWVVSADLHTKYTDAEAVDAVEAAGLILADTKNIEVDPTPAASHTANGIVVTMTAGIALVFGDACYVGIDGKMEKALADDAAITIPATHLCIATIAENAAGLFLVKGWAHDDSWAFDVGLSVYLSAATAGLITKTMPVKVTGNQVQVLGTCLVADTIYWNPSPVVVEYA